ncbi:FAD-dependent oxidoreductase [Pseudonocardia xinjiangensis]|uniref:FAD-dependent oxidoreductase n=1 Tax=Pseudonocardia xinjiangensis TaxID=75289 RepID=UPI003D92AD70
MARIVVLGGAMTGLATAALLGRDGHDVTVLERDVAEPKGDADELWRTWDRPGVSQFRLPHIMLGAWNKVMEEDLPEVLDEVVRLGCSHVNTIAIQPDTLTGGPRPGDEELRNLIGRRPVVEAALATVAARTPGVTIRRGTKAESLVATAGADGVPQVGGVVTQDGEVLTADLVVDAMGRNTTLDRMLDAIGATGPEVQAEDLGFVYYCRHFRNNEPRTMPVVGAVIPYEGMTLLVIPADADTYCLVFSVASNDHDMRGLREVDAWERALALFPNFAPVRAVSTPITDIQVMNGGGDRRRSLLVDGAPVVTGLVAVGDSAVRTNPLLGRGASTGLVQARTLRDVLREVTPDRPDELALRFAEAVEATVGPMYRFTLDQDRHRMAEVQAEIAGRPYPPAGAGWRLQRALQMMFAQDPDALRALFRAAHRIEAFDTDTLPDTLRVKIEELDADRPVYPPGGPTRTQLLAAVSGRAAQSAPA